MSTDGPALSREERRALLRRHHPDLGGDAADFVRVIAALERRPEPLRPVTTVATDRLGGGRWRRRGRRLVTRVRTTLPRRLPGARRYAQI